MLPHTLTGMIGFIIFTGWIIGMIITDNSQSDRIQELTEEMNKQISEVIEASTPIDTILSAGGTIISMLTLTISYLGVFSSAISSLPSQFQVIFVIVSITVIFGIYRFIRGGVFDF